MAGPALVNLKASADGLHIPLELLPELGAGQVYQAHRDGLAVVILPGVASEAERAAAAARLRAIWAAQAYEEEPPGLVDAEVEAYRRERDAKEQGGEGSH